MTASSILKTSFKNLMATLGLIVFFQYAAFSNTDIIGTIWIDDDANGTYNGEIGTSGVTVELLEAESLALVASVVSAGGNFEFLNQSPGIYIINIPASQFAAGGALEGSNSCSGFTPANDMIDNNDNGSDTDPMDVQSSTFTLLDDDPSTNVLIDYIDFCFVANTCSSPNPFASISCEQITETDVICDMTTLGTFCYILPDVLSGGNQPSPLCPGNNNNADNVSWFSFIAAGGNYSISITSEGCTQAQLSPSGIQVGVYQDCSFSESVFCSPTCTTTGINILSDVLEEGEIYFMFIDGCGNTTCTYSIDIIGTPTPPSLTPDAVCLDNNGVLECDSTAYCIDGDVFFQVTGISISADYSWNITTVAGSPYLGNTSPTTADNSLQISFSGEGEYLVCLNSIDNGCDNWNGSECIKVTTLDDIEFVGDEVFPDQFICFDDSYSIDALDVIDLNGDGTSGWQGPTDQINLGSNQATIMTPSCSYTQSFFLDTYEEEGPVNAYLAVCGQDFPLQIEDFTLTEESFASGSIIMIDNVLSSSPNVNGCDSITNYAIEILDIVDGFMNPPECTFNSVILDFDYNDVASTNFIFLNFVWTDPFGNVLFDTQGNNDPTDLVVPTGSPNGTYTLTVTITKNGFSCEYIYPVEVDFSIIQPPTPMISGITMVCSGSNSEANYTATGGNPSFNYIWTIPADAEIVQTGGPQGNMITIDWSGSAGGDINVQSENECGFSAVANLTITVIPTTTPDFIIDPEVCIGGQTSVESSGIDPNIVSYLWTFGGAQIVSGSSGNIGPNVLSWSTSGTKTVTLQTTNTSGCQSDPATKTIEVIAPLGAVDMICQPTINDILFIWQAQPGVNYEVEIFTGQTGVFEGNSSYRVSDLVGGETVTLELLQTETNGLCTDPVSSLMTCVAQDCPVIAIALSAAQTTFCENEDTEITLNAIVTSQVNGTGSFSGSGIVNPIGLFNPSQANGGINTITYTYIDNNGCTGSETIDLLVVPAPVSSFVADVTEVCEGGTITLNYTGTPDVGSYMWENDDLTIADQANPSLTFLTPGQKTITLIVQKDGCQSMQSSLIVEVLETPLATFILDSERICISDELQLQYTGGSDVDNYDWDVGVGSVDNVPNPLVSFIFPGQKTIELIVSKGICISEVYNQTLIVDQILDSPFLTCSASNGSITFEWDPVSGASSYLVSVNGEAPFESTTSTLSIDNLEDGEVVEVSIEAISDGSCPNTISSLSCTSLISSTSDNERNPVRLFPNPTRDILYLENIEEIDSYTILDLQGKVVLTGTYKEGIDIRSLVSGLFFIQLSNDDKQRIEVLKFAKE